MAVSRLAPEAYAAQWCECIAAGCLPASAARLTAWLTRLCFVDRQGAAIEVFAIEPLNRRLRRTAVCHFDEAKTPRTAGLAVSNETHIVHRTILLEELADVIFRGGKRQIANIDSHGMSSI